MMNIRLIFITLFVSTSAFAQEDTEVSTSAVGEGTRETRVSDKNPNPRLSKYVHLDSQLSLEYRSDKLRENQNPDTTNIRNFSLLVDLFDDESSSLTLELLGDENQTGDLNVNVGKLYYQGRMDLYGGADYDTSVRAGVMKLGYGILNEIDGLFAVLPSYYSYLYDLPRGLDTGISATTEVFTKEVTLTGGVYAGKNLRQTDNKNRGLDVAPHNIKLAWQSTKDTVVAANYFSRKYEGQPLIRGIGIEYHQMSIFRLYGFQLDVDFEAWDISASLNGVENRGQAGLVGPRLSFRKIFFQPYFGMERWGQDGTPSSTETFFTGKLGYNFNKHIALVLEQTQIKNTTTNIYKENSLQARIVSQWQF